MSVPLYLQVLIASDSTAMYVEFLFGQTTKVPVCSLSVFSFERSFKLSSRKSRRSEPSTSSSRIGYVNIAQCTPQYED